MKFLLIVIEFDMYIENVIVNFLIVWVNTILRERKFATHQI